jgi:uncharacterized small protein (TIGR04563 family)
MDKIEKRFYFPAAMLREIKTEAARLDRGISWCVEYAWKVARERLIAEGSEQVLPDHYRTGSTMDSRKQTLFCTPAMLREVDDAARLLERPLSWCVQQSWKLGLEAVKALPTARFESSQEEA